MNAAQTADKTKPRVLIADALSPRALEIFKERGIAADEAAGLKPDALKAKLKDYDGLAVRSATKVTADVFAAAPRLKVVGRAGIGVDNIDVAAATQRGVVVMNTPFGNSITTAEHTIALMFALARQLPAANASTHRGKWEKSRFLGVELYGKALGVIGCGNIGAIVAERAIALHMRVLAFDPFLSDERALQLGVEKTSLDELLARADFITLHAPLTEQTRGIIGKDALAKTKKGVRIINCARGGLVIEADLRAAIESGHVAGAALDVFMEEPAMANVLFGLEQVIATPHLGAATAEAQENVAVQVAEQMADFLLTGAVSNAVNMPSVTAEEAPRLKPYMKLAEQLGSFAGQISETGPRVVRIEYEGLVAGLNTKPLTAVALAGLLTPLMDSVNMVNAPVIARERKIDVSETRHDRPSDYQTMIRLTVTTERRTRTLAGTLFGGDKPRIVEIEGIGIEAELAPNMLYCRNEDKPGIIGALGKLLGDNGVNIATFHLGRDRQGGQAVALLAIDQKLSGDLLDCVRELPHVNQVKALRF